MDPINLWGETVTLMLHVDDVTVRHSYHNLKSEQFLGVRCRDSVPQFTKCCSHSIHFGTNPKWTLLDNQNGKFTREHWIQRITFAAEINAASSRGSARRDDMQRCGHTDRHTNAERNNTVAR